MAENSKISWTHHTLSPWWGCQRVSPGCGGAKGVGGCYAEAFALRLGKDLWGPTAPRKPASEATWGEPLKWNARAAKAGQRERVFCASMADVFEDRPDLVLLRARLFRLIEATPSLDWLLLTKRPEGMVRLAVEAGWPGAWPANVWAGCTVENQALAHTRIPHLLQVPAHVRFLSCEPLLEALDLTVIPANLEPLPGHEAWDYVNALTGHGYHPQGDVSKRRCYPRIHWLIAGGESGPGARPFDLTWARSLRDQCAAAGTAYFFKQAGSQPVVDGKRLVLGHRKGEAPAEWPADLRVQQFPTVTP